MFHILYAFRPKGLCKGNVIAWPIIAVGRLQYSNGAMPSGTAFNGITEIVECYRPSYFLNIIKFARQFESDIITTITYRCIYKHIYYRYIGFELLVNFNFHARIRGKGTLGPFSASSARTYSRRTQQIKI